MALIPASPAAAQLALYLLLVTKGLQPKHKAIYPHPTAPHPRQRVHHGLATAVSQLAGKPGDRTRE